MADAIGALCTTLILGVVLVGVSKAMGLEKAILYFLALFAALLAIYSFTVYLVKPRNWPVFLKIIALANFVYCLVTWGILLRTEPSLFAYIYFTVETVIVLALAGTEWLYTVKFGLRKLE